MAILLQKECTLVWDIKTDLVVVGEDHGVALDFESHDLANVV